jgi:hypothetical protein
LNPKLATEFAARVNEVRIRGTRRVWYRSRSVSRGAGRANNKGGNGIVVAPVGSGTVTAALNRVEADNNGDGVLIDGSAYVGTDFNATATDSVAAGNSGTGFQATSLTAAVNLMILRSVAADNATGVSAQGSSSTVRIGQSAVTGNASGWTASAGSAVKSYGDNKIDGNASNQSAPPSISNK